jgi:hypothetical protein
MFDFLDFQTFPNRFEALKTITPKRNVKKIMENKIVLARLVKSGLASSLLNTRKFESALSENMENS